MTRTLTALALLATATVAHAGAKPSDAYFVKVDRETTTQVDREGAWTGLEVDWDNSAGATPGLTLDEHPGTGRLEATVHGDISSVGTILGWDTTGTQALVGLEPDEIDFMGRAQPLTGVEPDEIDFDGGTGEPLTGVEPDEIDYFGNCEPQGLIGVEPDEIDFRTAVTEDGEVFTMASNYAAYLIVSHEIDRAGTLTVEPTHTLVNENCL